MAQVTMADSSGLIKRLASSQAESETAIERRTTTAQPVDRELQAHLATMALRRNEALDTGDRFAC